MTTTSIPLPSHGGGGAEFLARHFPDAPRPWLDLSTGINPWPYPHDAVPSEAWAALPTPSADDACREAAAAYLGVGRSRLALTPGSQAALSLLPRLFSPTTVAVVTPTYAEHAAMWRAAGHQVRAVTDVEEGGEAEVLIVVNPNNPDGRVRSSTVMRDLGRRRAESGRLLVIDEAFADPTPEIGLKDGGDNVVVYRSFGKFFGLAGARLGITVAAPEIVRRLEGMIGPWAVSGPALAIAARALADREWRAVTRVRLAETTAALRSLFARAGLPVVGGCDLFTLVERDDAPALFVRLCRRGIHVRRFDHDPRRLRFGLPPDARSFQRLEAALGA